MEYRLKSKLSKETILQKLKNDTLYTASVIRPQLYFGSETFYGQITEERIRLGVNHLGRGNYPVFEIFLLQEDTHTEILITSDVEEQNNLGNVMLISTGLVLLVVFSLLGIVLSLKKPEQYTLTGTLIIAAIIIAVTALMIAGNKASSRSFYEHDLNKIISVLS